MEKIGSPDLPDFRVDLLSDGDFAYSRENLFGIVGTDEKMCLICTGSPVKNCWIGCRNYVQSDLVRPW